jgi:hypothetical protein
MVNGQECLLIQNAFLNFDFSIHLEPGVEQPLWKTLGGSVIIPLILGIPLFIWAQSTKLTLTLGLWTPKTEGVWRLWKTDKLTKFWKYAMQYGVIYSALLLVFPFTYGKPNNVLHSLLLI